MDADDLVTGSDELEVDLELRPTGEDDRFLGVMVALHGSDPSDAGYSRCRRQR